MTCAGNVDLLVEPVDVTASDDPIATASDAVAAALRDGRSALEVVSTGSTPHRLVVTEEGMRVGSLGDVALDAAVAAGATDLIDARTIGVITVSVPDGDVELFVRTHASPPSIIVMGATDVAGVRLTGVRADSPADRAGLNAGDVIVEFGGKPVKDLYGYTDALYAQKPGEGVDVVIVRVFEQLCRSNASRRSYAAASLGVGYQSHSDILVRVTGGNARCNAREHPSHDPIGCEDDERRPGT
jgi:membrane-associated protease RseP (regulator of RpoE activity)